MKLGHAMGEMQKPSKYGAEKEYGCTSDAECDGMEKCIDGICTNPCSPSPCPDDEFCLNEGNHSFSCVECTSNDQCPDREICKNNSCVDACTGNPCATTGQTCSSQSGHSYMCYGCSDDTACNADQFCDTGTKQCVPVCPDACPHQFCEIDGAHRAKCYGCTSDEGCETGETCDLTEGSETQYQCVKAFECPNAPHVTTILAVNEKGDTVVFGEGQINGNILSNVADGTTVGVYGNVSLKTDTWDKGLVGCTGNDVFTLTSGAIVNAPKLENLKIIGLGKPPVQVKGNGIKTELSNVTVDYRGDPSLAAITVNDKASLVLSGTNEIIISDSSGRAIEMLGGSDVTVNGKTTLNGMFYVFNDSAFNQTGGELIIENLPSGFPAFILGQNSSFVSEGTITAKDVYSFMQIDYATAVLNGKTNISPKESTNGVFIIGKGKLQINGEMTVDGNNGVFKPSDSPSSDRLIDIEINAPVTVKNTHESILFDLTSTGTDELNISINDKITAANDITIGIGTSHTSDKTSWKISGNAEIYNLRSVVAYANITVNSGAKLELFDFCNNTKLKCTVNKNFSVSPSSTSAGSIDTLFLTEGGNCLVPREEITCSADEFPAQKCLSHKENKCCDWEKEITLCGDASHVYCVTKTPTKGSDYTCENGSALENSIFYTHSFWR